LPKPSNHFEKDFIIFFIFIFRDVVTIKCRRAQIVAITGNGDYLTGRKNHRRQVLETGILKLLMRLSLYSACKEKP